MDGDSQMQGKPASSNSEVSTPSALKEEEKQKGTLEMWKGSPHHQSLAETVEQQGD